MANADKPGTGLTALLNGFKFITKPPDPAQAAPLLRWRGREAGRRLEPARHSGTTAVDDLLFIDRQKAALQSNTEQFLNGYPANNALLWGPRGTGKSSLVKAVFGRYRERGLRLVEVSRDSLAELHDICDELDRFTGKFVIFCDDLSFDARDTSYKTLKSLLDGSVSGLPGNALIYATSNRRHLLPEFRSENLEAGVHGGEIHQGESVEEKLSLSERFGVWLSFHPFSQEQYLRIAFHWLDRTGAAIGDKEQVRRAALQWALEKGSRSGRSAEQFARDWAGRALLSEQQ